MLEIKKLSKIYNSKGGVITKALDEVTLRFPDKGMVFLLGKSGSGKSTLLNVCGGLDVPTSGEIIVKGRSSETFSNSDFDSYRNTYIGFIFQEYNILNEFSVEDNIALALELQGKPKDRAKINELLKQVELENFAKRKPNTLSGGQKQRIAIARALIKDPEIIMADEPTGALDSNTGKQVLDTLKKLSETKLVIIVSHDREFAEYYGDRIIELKDGKILSDVSKTELDAKKVGHITMIDDNTISIKNGVELTNDDLKELNDFLKKSNNEILISNSVKEIKEYKQQAKITEDGSKETFIDTVWDKIDAKMYSKEDAKLIRSKLPVKHAAKIGVSNLKLKPIRLLFTIFLSVVSFILLGIVSTMTFYDKNEVSIESFRKSNMEYISIQKGYQLTTTYTDDDYSYTDNFVTLFGEDDKNNIINKYGRETIFCFNFSACPKVGDYYSSTSYRIDNSLYSNNSFYSVNINNFAYIDEHHDLRNRIIVGDYPTTSNQLMLSSFTFDSIKTFGLQDKDGNKININAYEDILNQKVYFNTYNGLNEFTVSGIYNVDDLIPEQYKSLIEGSSSYDSNEYYWEQERSSGIFTLALVNESFYEDNKINFYYPTYYSLGQYTDATINIDERIYSNTISTVNKAQPYNFNNNLIDSLAEDEIAINSAMLGSLISDYLNNNPELEEVINFFNNTASDGKSYMDHLEIFNYGERHIYDEELNEYELKIYSNEERINSFNILYELLPNFFNKADYTISQPDYAGDTNITIVGYVLSTESIFIMSDNLFDKYLFSMYENYTVQTTKYEADTNAIYSCVLIHNTGVYDDISKFVTDLYTINNDDSTIICKSSIMNTLEMVNSLFEGLTKGFLIAGVILAVFATLLLFNFISISITNKKREIGILRAVGARSLDVFKIFFSESFVIVLICCVIAVIGSGVTCGIINTMLGEQLNGIRLLVFGIPSIILIVALSLVVSFLSTFLPVYSIAKKKPVDSIRAI